MTIPQKEQVEVPEEAVKLAQKATGSTDEWCRLALQAAAPVLCAQEWERREDERQVRWLLDRLRRLDSLADEYDARGRMRNGLIGSDQASADLRCILTDARRYLDHPDTDVGVNARLDSIRQQAAQQERERVKEALRSRAAEDAARAARDAGYATRAVIYAAWKAALTTLDKETD